MHLTRKKKKLLLGILIAVVVVSVSFFVVKGFIGKKYTVIFDSDGGSKVASLKVEKNELAVKPSNPTKEGFIFEGWYYNGELFDFNTEITENITLEARWISSDKVSGVSLDREDITLKVKDTTTLVATVTPDSAKNKNVTWESSDSAIVSVDENGNIKALKEGEAIITVVTEDGEYDASCTVTVTKTIVSVTGVTISGSKTVKVGATALLIANIKPSNATNKNVSWSSSNDKIVKVSDRGIITGVSVGTAKITVTTEDGEKTASVDITVKENNNTQKPEAQKPNEGETQEQPKEEDKEVKVTGVKITGANSVYMNEKITLTAVIEPSNATNKEVEWSVDKTECAEINAKGELTGKEECDAVIVTVKTKDGNKEATHTVEVKAKYAIELTKSYQDGEDTHELKGYTIKVLRNNVEWQDYTSITFKAGQEYKKGEALVTTEQFDESIKTATITTAKKTIKNVAVTVSG